MWHEQRQVTFLKEVWIVQLEIQMCGKGRQWCAMCVIHWGAMTTEDVRERRGWCGLFRQGQEHGDRGTWRITVISQQKYFISRAVLFKLYSQQKTAGLIKAFILVPKWTHIGMGQHHGFRNARGQRRKPSYTNISYTYMMWRAWNSLHNISEFQPSWLANVAINDTCEMILRNYQVLILKDTQKISCRDSRPSL